jgi:dynein heavy chain
MIVGAAFSGKSKITEVLDKGMGLLHGQEGFVKVQQLKLNPKSITSDQLYGKLDPNTKSWTDGVVAILMRKCAE